MSPRGLNIALGLISLSLGGGIYIIFRENTFIAEIFDGFFLTAVLRRNLAQFSSEFIRYYLPDFLWGFSLCCGITALNFTSRKALIISCLAGFLTGVLWELMQYSGVFSGVSDLADVAMYLVASILCIIVNIIFIKERKKQ